ncbi:MAG: hypothetical protein O2912_01475 [Proteobacteria bacterium]|nr:hypothetical protein [Pseudomonadota bacterium]
MHDGVSLEKLNIPTAVICTTAFEHEAHVQRAALGMDELKPVIITHPLSTISEADIDSRAEEAVVQIEKVLLGA